MPAGFNHYLPLTEQEKDEIWAEGIIVLDTNVLLSVYKLPAKHRQQLLDVLTSDNICNRLFIPHQVAEEFYRTRVNVIGQQEKAADDFDRNVGKAIDDVLSVLAQGHEHHPYLDKKGFKSRILELWDKERDEISARRAEHSITVDEDPVINGLNSLMDSRIGSAFSDQEMIQIQEEAKKRFEKGIPPGYMDAKKDPDNALGDIIIWKQILAEMSKQPSHVVFVTDDRKEDWWEIARGKKLGPRPELRKEYVDTTGKLLELSTPRRFVEWAAKLQHELKINQASLAVMFDILDDLSLEQRKLVSTPNHKPTPEEMAEWFLENYEDPANGVPYDGREGGYQYVNGGPYWGSDVLYESFPDASEEDVKKAVDIIECNGGPEWVRVGQY